MRHHRNVLGIKTFDLLKQHSTYSWEKDISVTHMCVYTTLCPCVLNVMWIVQLVEGIRHTVCVCLRWRSTSAHTHTHLIREKLQQERAQKNYTQTLRIQLTLHQTDAEKAQRQKHRWIRKEVNK